MTKEVVLCSHNDCTGCFACEGICPVSAITQVTNNEGFRYPKIDVDKCISCKKCATICPVLTPVDKLPEGKIYASWTYNESVRGKSSSGGIFSELAVNILESGGVIIGASMNSQGYVHHFIADSLSEIESLRGSKYVQSLIEGTLYKKIFQLLKEGKKVLFTGCPCQVAAVKNFCKGQNELYTVDIICHGVPSPELFAKLYSDIKKKYPKLKAYNFRLLKSWGVSANICIEGEQDCRTISGPLSFFQSAFLKGLMHRENCYNCVYATKERIGDITLGDFWGIGQDKPISEEYKLGCSLLSINSSKGLILFQNIKNNIFFEEREITETIKGGNEQLVYPSKRPVERDLFYEDAFSMSYKKLSLKYNLNLAKSPSRVKSALAYLHKFVMK